MDKILIEPSGYCCRRLLGPASDGVVECVRIELVKIGGKYHGSFDPDQSPDRSHSG